MTYSLCKKSISKVIRDYHKGNVRLSLPKIELIYLQSVFHASTRSHSTAIIPSAIC